MSAPVPNVCSTESLAVLRSNISQNERHSPTTRSSSTIAVRRAPPSYTGRNARQFILEVSITCHSFLEQYDVLNTMFNNPRMTLMDLYIIFQRQQLLLRYSQQVQERRQVAARASLHSRRVAHQISRIPRLISREAGQLQSVDMTLDPDRIPHQEQDHGNQILRSMVWPLRYNDPYDNLVG